MDYTVDTVQNICDKACTGGCQCHLCICCSACSVQCTCSAKISDLDEQMVNILGFGIENYRFGSNLKKIKNGQTQFLDFKRFRQHIVHINSFFKALYININDLNISGKSRIFMNRYVWVTKVMTAMGNQMKTSLKKICKTRKYTL